METKTLTFDFTYLRDKKISSANENSGIRKYHLAEEGVWSILDIQSTQGISKFEPKTFVELINTSISYLYKFFRNKYILIEQDGSDTKYKFTYSTHSEPKEFFTTVYIGKETGNIYYSNQGDDVVFSNIREIIPTLDIKNVIRAIQIFKISQDFQPFNESLYIEAKDINNSNSSYLTIFNSLESQLSTKTIFNAVDDITRIKEFLYHLLKLSLFYRPFFFAIKLVSMMDAQGVGRMNGVSGDMDEMITDFNKGLCPPKMWGSIIEINTEDLRFDMCLDLARDLSSEYYSYDYNKYVQNVQADFKYKNGMLLKSLIENSENEESNLYSEDFLKRLSSTFEIDYSVIVDRMKDIEFSYKEKMYSMEISSFSIMKKSPNNSSMMNLMFVTEKMGYKYIKRIHDILSRL